MVGERSDLKLTQQPSGGGGSLEHKLLLTFKILTPPLKFSSVPFNLTLFIQRLLVFRNLGPDLRLPTVAGKILF